MNDWPLKKFLSGVLFALIGVWCLYYLDLIGLHLTLVRQVVGFLFLMFIPGLAALRAFTLRNLGGSKSLLYSAALSVAILMFTGVLLNAVLPAFGIKNPLTTMPLLVSLTVEIVVFSVLSWIRERRSVPVANKVCQAAGFLTPTALFLFLLPLVSILGTQLENNIGINVILITLIILIVLVLVLAGFTGFISERYYPLAVFSVTLSLLFYRSLISPYISGYDIHEEFAAASRVLAAGYWDAAGASLINSLPAINVLPAAVANISGLSLTLLFKAMYPLLFAIACVGLYELFKTQMGAKIALFSVFFLVTAGRVYYDIALIPRQLAATVFFVVCLFILVDRKLPLYVRALFLVISGTALVLSHYGLAFIFIGIFAVHILVEWLSSKKSVRLFWLKLKVSIGITTKDNPETSAAISLSPSFLPMVLFLTVFTFTWYLYTSSGLVVSSYGERVSGMIKLVSTDLFRSSNAFIPAPAAGYSENSSSIMLSYLGQGAAYFKEILVIIGIFAYTWGIAGINISRTYLWLTVFPAFMFAATLSSQVESLLFLAIVVLALIAFIPSLRRHALVLVSSAAVAGVAFWYLFPLAAAKYAPPNISRLIAGSGFDVDRLENITSFILAPFFIIGILAAVQIIGRIGIRPIFKNAAKSYVWAPVTGAFLCVGLLLDSGVAWHLTGSYANTPSLIQSWVEKKGSIAQKADFYSAVTPVSDVLSAAWLREHRIQSHQIYATFLDAHVHPLTSYGLIPVDETVRMSTFVKSVPENTYVYLQYLNVHEGVGTTFGKIIGYGNLRTFFNLSDVAPAWSKLNKIFSDGGSEIYR